VSVAALSKCKHIFKMWYYFDLVCGAMFSQCEGPASRCLLLHPATDMDGDGQLSFGEFVDMMFAKPS
jgi:hypothetical protein